jgi:hypothetical protein
MLRIESWRRSPSSSLNSSFLFEIPLLLKTLVDPKIRRIGDNEHARPVAVFLKQDDDAPMRSALLPFSQRMKDRNRYALFVAVSLKIKQNPMCSTCRCFIETE